MMNEHTEIAKIIGHVSPIAESVIARLLIQHGINPLDPDLPFYVSTVASSIQARTLLEHGQGVVSQN